MNMMIVVILASVAVGLLPKTFGNRQNKLCLAIATALTLVYLVRPVLMT